MGLVVAVYGGGTAAILVLWVLPRPPDKNEAFGKTLLQIAIQQSKTQCCSDLLEIVANAEQNTAVGIIRYWRVWRWALVPLETSSTLTAQLYICCLLAAYLGSQ